MENLMSHTDKHVPKINVLEFVKSHRLKENGQSTFVSQALGFCDRAS